MFAFHQLAAAPSSAAYYLLLPHNSPQIISVAPHRGGLLFVLIAHCCSVMSSLLVSHPRKGETYCCWERAVCFGYVTLTRHLSTTHFKTDWRRIKPQRQWNKGHCRWVSKVECEIKAQSFWEKQDIECLWKKRANEADPCYVVKSWRYPGYKQSERSKGALWQRKGGSVLRSLY